MTDEKFSRNYDVFNAFLVEDAEYDGQSELQQRLSPKTIIVYGAAPKAIFGKYADEGIEIISFESEFSKTRRQVNACWEQVQPEILERQRVDNLLDIQKTTQTSRREKTLNGEENLRQKKERAIGTIQKRAKNGIQT